MNNPKNKHSRRAAGFTLIEVLLVILILGSLAAVLAVTIGGSREKAQKDTTDLMVKKLANKLEMYALDIGHYPTESEGGLNALLVKPSFDNEKLAERWTKPYIVPGDLEDAWHNKFNYETGEPGAQPAFKVWSNGPDGQSNTADDIRNWEEGK